ncbi:MAG: hypothetical protein DRI57_07180, partial [Deltaproteobacteria bacterium]
MSSSFSATGTRPNVTDSYVYDAFGNLRDRLGTTVNHYLYTGEQYDPDAGLYYLRARYYSPGNGRFASQDSWQGRISDPVTLHKYLYANANPVMYVDPTGYMSIQEINSVMRILGNISRIGIRTINAYDKATS